MGWIPDKQGLTLEIVWFDEALVELRVRCTSEWFAAAADCYASYDVFQNCAAAFRGFPRTPDDQREFTFGTLAHDGVQVRLTCSDAAGHPRVDVRVRSEKGKAEFDFAIEASAVDAFVAELDGASIRHGRVAVLQRAT